MSAQQLFNAFTPIGLIVIATVLHNDGAYLIPALIFSLVVAVIPIGAALEIGRAAEKAGKKQTAEKTAAPAAVTPSGTAG